MELARFDPDATWRTVTDEERRLDAECRHVNAARLRDLMADADVRAVQVPFVARGEHGRERTVDADASVSLLGRPGDFGLGRPGSFARRAVARVAEGNVAVIDQVETPCTIDDLARTLAGQILLGETGPGWGTGLRNPRVEFRLEHGLWAIPAIRFERPTIQEVSRELGIDTVDPDLPARPAVEADDSPQP